LARSPAQKLDDRRAKRLLQRNARRSGSLGEQEQAVGEQKEQPADQGQSADSSRHRVVDRRLLGFVTLNRAKRGAPDQQRIGQAAERDRRQHEGQPARSGIEWRRRDRRRVGRAGRRDQSARARLDAYAKWQAALGDMPIHSRSHAPDRRVAILRQTLEREMDDTRIGRVDLARAGVDDLRFAVEQLDTAEAGVQLLAELQRHLFRGGLQNRAGRRIRPHEVGVGLGRRGQQQRQQSRPTDCKNMSPHRGKPFADSRNEQRQRTKRRASIQLPTMRLTPAPHAYLHARIGGRATHSTWQPTGSRSREGKTLGRFNQRSESGGAAGRGQTRVAGLSAAR
jgi:hypothetical protein